MKKIFLVASMAALAASVGGCNCGGQSPVVTSFGALPGIIPPGGTAVLTWVVTDAESLSIDNGVGVVTGTVIAVSPADTTTYTLTATNKSGVTTMPATVTVDATKAPVSMAGFKIAPATNSPVAGAATGFTVTAVDASGATVNRYRGTVHFTLTDPSTQKVTPADYTFAPNDQGTHQVSATLITAGSSQILAQDASNPGFAGAATVNVVAAAASKCALSGLPSQARAGDPVGFRMTVTDTYDNVVTSGYAGTVSFASSDTRATPPSPFTFTAGDGGQHGFSAVFGTPGSQNVTATDAANSITCNGGPVEVSPGRASYIQLSGVPSTVTAGQTNAFTITAYDLYGNVAADFADTLTLTSSDIGGSFPANGAFSNGVASASVRLVSAGTRQIVASDPSNAAIRAQALIDVGPASAAVCAASGTPASARAGDAVPVTVTLLDAFANVATGYAGTVALTSGDARASLPASFTYGAGDQGSHGFSVRFGTPGAQRVTVTDGASSITCDSNPVAITNGPAAAFQISGAPSSATAGATSTFAITALDAYGNVAVDFTGTPSLSSTDPGGTFPVNDAFTNGMAAASVRLITAGTRQIAAADPANPALSAQALVSVGAAAAGACTAAGIPATARAGDPLSLHVTLTDAFGNVATGYAGTMSFSSADTRATLPASYAFAAGDQGARGFSVRFGTPGSQQVTATDSGNSITCDSGTVTISNGSAAAFQLAGVPASATAGATSAFTITAVDSYGNVATDFTGTPTLASTDPGGTFPVNASFANGVANASVRLITAGSRQVTATDPSNSALSAQALVSVGPAAASTCTAAGIPAASRAGEALGLVVTVLDAFGNVATGYAGTMSFTSADARATLPAGYTFVSGDQGAHGFSVRFGTLGSQTVTASDAASFISCVSDATSLSAGPASQFVLSSMPSAAIAGVEQAFVATARDSYGNLASDYAGPVSLASTDAAATFPTFGSFSSGVASFGVAFQTIGGQSVMVTDVATGFSGQGSPVAVHGLRYTAGGTGAETFQLVMDPASRPAQVTLRLVAQAGAAGYSAGFNIPADASRAQLVSIAQGNALNPGTSPAAIAASLAASGPMSNVLSAGISQKATDTTADATITAGQVLYTLVLKPNSLTPGVIFDGTRGFRAAVRDFEGNEVLSQEDFAVGKLELQ